MKREGVRTRKSSEKERESGTVRTWVIEIEGRQEGVETSKNSREREVSCEL